MRINDNNQGTKTHCTCYPMILVDESCFQLGIRCIKCGLSAEHRVKEYLEYLYGPSGSLTDQQRRKIRLLIAEAKLKLVEGESVGP